MALPLSLAAVVAVVALAGAQLGGCLAATFGGFQTTASFVDPNCQWPYSRPSDRTLVGFLLLLRCDLKPTYEQYRQLAGHRDFKAEPAAAAAPEVRQELELVATKIDQFYRDGLSILEMKDFCTYSTILPLAKLKQQAEGSKLLQLAYDLISIEIHRYCLAETIGRLPQVPYTIRDVVKIYVAGADRQLPDLNGDAQMEEAQGEGLGLGDVDDDAGGPFDVELAIRKNGSLRDVMGLLLTMPRQGVDEVQEFKRTCKLFLIDIEQHWQSMEMMSSMLATEGNGIKRMNNYIMRKLTPTKYADICSQLSARDSQ